MKSKKKQRLLALILSMVLMLSASISALAEGDVQTEASGTETTENQAAAQSLEQETVPETEVTTEEGEIDTQSAEISEEPVQETAKQETTEASGETTEPVQEVTGETTETEVPTTETVTEGETQSVEEQPEETTEETPAEEQTVSEEPVVSEAAEMKQEFTDENGNVTQTVTAYVPEGAFQATADQISMEVKLLNEEDTDYIKGMMEKKLLEGFYLDGYVLYQIDFKVNGEITKPAKAITISMTGNELAVEDTRNAHVFYYVPEDPEVEDDEDQLTEVTQKDQLIKSLEDAGESTENIEDYDYSEITVNEGNADTITVKGWESTIYGCYVEKEMAQEVTYEDDTVKVTVSADEKGIIPNKATLQVVPISNSGDTKDQYKEVEKKLQEKAESEEYEIAGFLAYDISFVDKDGKEVEPDGEVRVSLEYKNAVLPEGLTEEEAKDAEVSMLHLEEDEKGKVKDVVDMAEKEQIEAIATTESQQVEKVAVKTESFSTFTITWTRKGSDPFSFTTNIYVATVNADQYTELEADVENKDIISTGTPPTLYIDTISPSGENKNLYAITGNNRTYYFSQAFIATRSEETFNLVHNESITALQALEEKQVRYKLQGAGEYTDLQNGQVVIFVYSQEGASTEAGYYTEDGTRLGQSPGGYDNYNYTSIGNSAEGVLVNGECPNGAESSFRYSKKTYSYAYTSILKGGREIEPNYMRYFEGRLQYSMSDEDTDPSEREWVDVGSSEIRLIYRLQDTIETVDTSGTVKIDMFNFNGTTMNNNNNILKFTGSNVGNGDREIWNTWTGSITASSGKKYKNAAMQGIVKDKLYTSDGEVAGAEDNYTGYPKLAVGSDSQSLDYLFTDNKNTEAYTGLNHLFSLEDGYYTYDSAEHYAYLNTDNDNKNFTVYSEDGSKGDDGSGDFMPFNDIDESTRQNDYHFSMNIGFDFTQPENGTVNGDAMIFEFSGDDDVWIFIDGKLVLDIGGIHMASKGVINFAQGYAEVLTGPNEDQWDVDENKALQVDDSARSGYSVVNNTRKTFVELFGKDALKGNTFAAGTTHRLEFFYLERGAGESNCSLKFNLQPQESNTLTVSKEITNTDKEKYANIEFDFKVELEDAVGAGDYHEMPEGTPYTLMKDGEVIDTTRTVGSNGIFTLKHGESAVFSDLDPELKYRVQEVSVTSDKFDQVIINDKAADYFGEDGENVDLGEDGILKDGQNFIASTGDLLLGQVRAVTFKNRCSSQNLNELQITKQMKGDLQTDDTFTFQVWLENSDGELAPYTGEYYLKKGNKNYHYVDNELVEWGEPEEGVSQVCGSADAGGKISKVPAGYTVVITQILSGTSFKVEEVDLGTQYEEPEKELTPGTYGTSNVTGADGEILLGTNAQVTITNQYKNIDVSFTKTDENGNRLKGVKFALYEDETSESPIDGTETESDQNGLVKFKDLQQGTYYLRETSTPEGYIAAGPWQIEVGNPAGGYTITGPGVSGDCESGYQIVNNSFSSSIDVDKSVKVLDYDDRTYQITLSAKSILNRIAQSGEPVDVVLVFDTSKSMDFPSDLETVLEEATFGDLTKYAEENGIHQTYYCIEHSSAATVFALKYEDEEWKYTDVSKNQWHDVGYEKDDINPDEKYDFYISTRENTRLDSLKSAALKFIDKLKNLSDENKVGLVTFAETANYNAIHTGLAPLSDNYQQLTENGIKLLDSTYTASGTNQADALEKAAEMLKNAETGHRQYVILLTDGAPNWKIQSGDKKVQISADKAWEAIEAQAKILDKMHVTLMTLGVGISYVDAGIIAGEGNHDDLASTHLKAISSEKDGKPYYYNADNASELESYFDSLFSTIVNGIPVENVTVTDVIDPRFELVDTDTIPEGGTYDDKTGTITWNNVTLPYVSGDGDGWTVTFTVKAKDEFMGGNVIPTNGPSSGVSSGDSTEPFPQPAVNVKSLELEVPSVEETIYLGDSVNVAENVAKIKAVLAKKVKSDVQQGESETFEIPESCQLTDDDIVGLLNEDQITKNYSYEETDDVVGQFVYSLAITESMKPDDANFNEDFDSNEVGTARELYTLKVQYIPIIVDHRTADGYTYDSSNTEQYGDISSTTRAQGRYELDVIAGSIDIIKKLDNPADEDQNFSFLITSVTGDSITVTITVEAGATEGRLNDTEKAKLTDLLKRGAWTVTEITTTGYSVAEVEAGEDTNSACNIGDASIIFTMGTAKDGTTDTLNTEGYSEGRLGVAVFTNEKVISDWQITKVSSTGNNAITLQGARFTLLEGGEVKYYGQSNSSGVVEWFDDEDCSGTPIENSALKPGTYTLSEETAPAGYSPSSETWTVNITANGIRAITANNGETIETAVDGNTTIFYFKNDALYALPSSGGPGIFLYMIGGTLFLMAGSLMIYINRRRGVLRK